MLLKSHITWPQVFQSYVLNALVKGWKGWQRDWFKTEECTSFLCATHRMAGYGMIGGESIFPVILFLTKHTTYFTADQPAVSYHLKECGQKSNTKIATLVLSVPSRSYLRTSLPDTNKFLLLSATNP